MEGRGKEREAGSEISVIGSVNYACIKELTDNS